MFARFAHTEDDAAQATKECTAWHALVPTAAERFDVHGGQAFGQYLADTAGRLLGAEFLQGWDQPAARTGFYFCLPCEGRQDRAGTAADVLAVSAGPADYHPIFQYRGMAGPACKRDGRRAVWLCHAGVAALADALGVAGLPAPDIPADYVPTMVLAIVAWPGEDLPPTGISGDTVLPHVFVEHVVHLRCPSCRHRVWTPHLDQGRTTACPACKAKLRIEGDATPQLQVRAQCPACRFRLRLELGQIGGVLNCHNCRRPLHLAKHRITNAELAATLARVSPQVPDAMSLPAGQGAPAIQPAPQPPPAQPMADSGPPAQPLIRESADTEAAIALPPAAAGATLDEMRRQVEELRSHIQAAEESNRKAAACLEQLAAQLAVRETAPGPPRSENSPGS